MRNNTARPYGYIAWQFEYDDADHDHGDKTFLGETGRLQRRGRGGPSSAGRRRTPRFIARHLYHFFVADEVPVPQWPHTAPRDPHAIDLMCGAYFDSGYRISAMLRALFNADFFKSEAGALRPHQEPHRDGGRHPCAWPAAWSCRPPTPTPPPASCAAMGQVPMNPPSVEGWQGGSEWINTGAYVQRVNFASRVLGRSAPSRASRPSSPASGTSPTAADWPPRSWWTPAWKSSGPLDVPDTTPRGAHRLRAAPGATSGLPTRRQVRSRSAPSAALLQLVVTTPEYQLV